MGPPDGEVGEVKVFGADEQHAAPVDVARWVELARHVLVAEGVAGDAELSLLFVDEPTISGLNRRFMDADGPTDVLAFPIDDEIVESGRSPDSGTTGPDRPDVEAGEVPILLGDVMICPAVAASNAGERNRSTDDEVALLVVHGILHVLGMDHADPETEAEMFAKQDDLLARFHRPRSG